MKTFFFVTSIYLSLWVGTHKLSNINYYNNNSLGKDQKSVISPKSQNIVQSNRVSKNTDKKAVNEQNTNRNRVMAVKSETVCE